MNLKNKLSIIRSHHIKADTYVMDLIEKDISNSLIEKSLSLNFKLKILKNSFKETDTFNRLEIEKLLLSEIEENKKIFGDFK